MILGQLSWMDGCISRVFFWYHALLRSSLRNMLRLFQLKEKQLKEVLFHLCYVQLTDYLIDQVLNDMMSGFKFAAVGLKKPKYIACEFIVVIKSITFSFLQHHCDYEVLSVFNKCFLDLPENIVFFFFASAAFYNQHQHVHTILVYFWQFYLLLAVLLKHFVFDDSADFSHYSIFYFFRSIGFWFIV